MAAGSGSNRVLQGIAVLFEETSDNIKIDLPGVRGEKILHIFYSIHLGDAPSWTSSAK